jgi:hypothetical protein
VHGPVAGLLSATPGFARSALCDSRRLAGTWRGEVRPPRRAATRGATTTCETAATWGSFAGINARTRCSAFRTPSSPTPMWIVVSLTRSSVATSRARSTSPSDGASKCGKSWLRQMVLPDALIVQCRLKKTTLGYLQGCAEPARDTSRGREHKWDNLEGARRNAR